MLDYDYCYIGKGVTKVMGAISTLDAKKAYHEFMKQQGNRDSELGKFSTITNIKLKELAVELTKNAERLNECIQTRQEIREKLQKELLKELRAGAFVSTLTGVDIKLWEQSKGFKSLSEDALYSKVFWANVQESDVFELYKGTLEAYDNGLITASQAIKAAKSGLFDVSNEDRQTKAVDYLLGKAEKAEDHQFNAQLKRVKTGVKSEIYFGNTNRVQEVEMKYKEIVNNQQREQLNVPNCTEFLKFASLRATRDEVYQNLLDAINKNKVITGTLLPEGYVFDPEINGDAFEDREQLVKPNARIKDVENYLSMGIDKNEVVEVKTFINNPSRATTDKDFMDSEYVKVYQERQAAPSIILNGINRFNPKEVASGIKLANSRVDRKNNGKER